MLSDQSDPGEPFANAREPLAQEFKRRAPSTPTAFLVVVNHFKSKGTRRRDRRQRRRVQGAFNGDRVASGARAGRLREGDCQADGTEKIFLVGDFNSYTQEDPMQVLYQSGLRQPAQRRPEGHVVRVRRHGRVARPRAGQPGGGQPGHRARRLADQRRGVGGVRVQPLQLQRDAALPAEPVPGLRPQPGARRPERAVLASRTRRSPRRPRRHGAEEEGHVTRIDVTVTGAQGVTPDRHRRVLGGRARRWPRPRWRRRGERDRRAVPERRDPGRARCATSATR